MSEKFFNLVMKALAHKLIPEKPATEMEKLAGKTYAEVPVSPLAGC